MMQVSCCLGFTAPPPPETLPLYSPMAFGFPQVISHPIALVALLERLPGPAGAQSLATALVQLKQLKDLWVGLFHNNIGAVPQGTELKTSHEPFSSLSC